MRELVSLAATAAALLAVIGVAVFAGGDRSVLVPVPEAVTEGFMREITMRRFDLAMHYLAKDRQRRETPQTLGALFAPLLEAAGEVNAVDGTPHWVQGDNAWAAATVEGDRGSPSCEFALVRESGLWKISGVTVGTR